MDDSLLHTLVLPACLSVLAGLAVGFVLFRLIESVGRLTTRPASRPAASCGTCDGSRYGR
jgi:hypothetical protein